MKRVLSLILVCVMLGAGAACAEDYTVAEKLVKQLAAGSGFSGVLTLEADTEAFSTLGPVTVDVDYIYVRPEEISLGEHRADLTLMNGENAVSSAHVQLLEGKLAVQADVLGPEWYPVAMPEAAQEAQADSWTDTAFKLLTTLQAVKGLDRDVDAALEKALETFSTRIDIWIEGYRQSAILGKLEDGTTTMQVDYAITPAAIKAEVKQLVFELLADEGALTALRAALAYDMGVYLDPRYQQWYFDCIDALPLSDDLTISRVFSMKGDTLSLQLKLPMYDPSLGAFTLCYERIAGDEDLPQENVLSMEGENQLWELKYQSYSSMTGVEVMQGALRREITADFTVADEAVQPFAAAFTLRHQITESRDEEGRDVYACDAAFTLAPDGDTHFEEIEAMLSSRFVSEERKSAATEISATLTLSSADEAIELTLEGASRKKWEPEAVSLSAQPDWEALLPGAAVRTLAALNDFIQLSEAAND